MTQTIYSQIASIAAPIVQHYHTDVSKHDRDALRSFKIGDSALWACYPCGSHMVRVSYSADMTIMHRLELAKRNCDHMHAVDKVYGRQISQWYLLESVRGQSGIVRQVSVEQAHQICADKVEALITSTVRKAA